MFVAPVVARQEVEQKQLSKMAFNERKNYKIIKMS